MEMQQSKVRWFQTEWGVGKPSPAEEIIIKELSKYMLWWNREVSFEGLLLPTKGWARFDFHLEHFNTCIEYHGKQWHLSPEKQLADKIKAQFCKDHDIRLIVWSGKDFYHIPGLVKGLMNELGVKGWY